MAGKNIAKMKYKDKYHKETGLILNHCEIKIDKGSKKVTYTHREFKVIISNDKNYVVENEYGSLQIVDKVYTKYSSKTALNKVSVYEQKWHSRYFEDYLIATTISTFTEKVTKTRLKKALYKFIEKEAYFYTGLKNIIEQQLSNKVTNP